jgi:hypothetical protein
MNRFEHANNAGLPAGDKPTAAPHVSDLSPEEINRYVARGRALRSAYFAEYGRRVARNWASVFNRPGRLAPQRHHGRRAVSA